MQKRVRAILGYKKGPPVYSLLKYLIKYSRSKLLIASDTDAPNLIDPENDLESWFPVERFKEEFEHNRYLPNAFSNAAGKNVNSSTWTKSLPYHRFQLISDKFRDAKNPHE